MNETTEQWKARRVQELKSEIKMIEEYLANGEVLNWKERGTGRSYNTRRRKRFGGLHESRKFEFEQRLIVCKNELENVVLK